MFKKINIGPKYFLVLIFISIVPLGIISTFNYYYSKSQLEKSTVGNMRAINDSRVAHINDLVQLRQEQAKILAGTYVCRQLRAEGANSPEIVSAIQYHIESIYGELQTHPRSEYHDIDRKSAIENISVWDIHGNIIANTNRALIGNKMPFKFLYILHDKGAYFKGFEKDLLTGKKFLTVLEGVRNWDSGEYAGVVFLKMKAEALHDITTAREGLGGTAETYLVDNENFMITESRFVEDAVLKVQVDTEGTKACFENRKAPKIYRNYMGNLVLGVQRYLPDEQWCLLTEIDAGEAFAPVIVFRNRILVVLGCLVIIVVILVHLSGRTFILPIVQLRDASLKVARGDYQAQVDINDEDELGELAKAFNQMTKILGNTTSQLREKNKILEEQKEELKKFDQLKSEFVSMVSHELRTPMAIIKGSISQLLEEAKGETKELLEIALRNINRLVNLINNLLDLSKIEAGKIELHREKVNIAAIIRDVCLGFQPEARRKNIEIRYRASRENIEADIDKDKIIQVFINLTNNALKFVDKGYIELSVEEQPSRIVCAVTDTGKGISREDQQKVFNKFQQFGRKSSAGVKGTGLGLSICKGLIELHGGDIWLESEEGKGAKFLFSLPK